MVKSLTEDAIAKRFITVEENEKCELQKISFHDTEEFNFAYDIVDAVAKKSPDKLAMLHLSKEREERRFTFKDISDYSNKAANYFKSLGIQKGDKVILVLKRHYQYWISMLGLHKIGAIAIPCSNLLVAHDFEYRIQAAGVTSIICTPDDGICEYVEQGDNVFHYLKNKMIVNGGKRDGWRDFDQEIEAFPATFERPTSPEEAIHGDDTCLMMFTSGTTKYPKLTAHNHKYCLGHFITARYWNQVDPDGIHLTMSDTGWGKALWGKLYGQWTCEAPIFVYDYDAFNAKEILQMIEEYKITTFCAPPTVYRVMIRMNIAKFDLSSLQHVCTAGEALNPEVFYQFEKATGHMIYEGFGQTETTMVLGTINGMEPRPGSMGKPSPLYDVHILRPDGTECDLNEEGEICIRTAETVPPGLFIGYYNDEERTNGAWHDGYYHTGDQAYMDQDGYCWYSGRIDDLIKAAGYRIGPFEIESDLMKLPYVLECAVTAVPDKVRGQAIKASIVLTQGTEGTEELKKEIFKYINEKIASYKRPRIVEFVDEMPKTTSGKIRRVEIRQNDWK